MVVLPRLLPLLLLLTASLAALLATNAHSSYPGPLAHTVHSTNMFAATFAPLYGLASPLTRTRRLAHLLPRTELARPTLAAHTPAERPRNAPGLQISAEQRVASNPTRTLVDLGAAPYNRSRCCSHAVRDTTQLRRTVQMAEGRLLHGQAQGRVSS